MKKENDKPEEPTAELIGKAQGGDMDALGKLWESCQTKVTGILRSKYPGLSIHDIEDIVQDTGIKVSKSIGGYQGSSSFDTWVIKIAMNTTRDYFRKFLSRIETTHLQDGMDVDHEAAIHMGMRTHSETALEILGSREKIAEIYYIISQLPESQRRCLVMAIDGKTYHEISERTGYKIGSVGTYLHLAREKLTSLR